MIDIKNIHPDIYELFNNKRICVVAGGPISKGCGHSIDNDYDIVVRINGIHHNYPYSEEVKTNYGSQCDILFRENHHLFGVMNNLGDKNYSDILDKIGVKDIILYDCGDSCEKEVNRLKDCNGSFICHRLSEGSGVVSSLRKFYTGYQNPTTGLTAITSISYCSPKSIDLFGFSFYHDYVHDNIYYPEGFVKTKSSEYDLLKHNYKRDLEVFASHVYWICMPNMDKIMSDFIKEKIKEKI